MVLRYTSFFTIDQTFTTLLTKKTSTLYPFAELLFFKDTYRADITLPSRDLHRRGKENLDVCGFSKLA